MNTKKYSGFGEKTQGYGALSGIYFICLILSMPDIFSATKLLKYLKGNYIIYPGLDMPVPRNPMLFLRNV